MSCQNSQRSILVYRRTALLLDLCAFVKLGGWPRLLSRKCYNNAVITFYSDDILKWQK